MSGLVRAKPDEVWDVLSDGWLFALWVVGASRIRAVEAEWPAATASIHHSFGAWPLLIDDVTSVTSSEPPRVLELRARAWPMGEAQVRIVLEPDDEGTRVMMEEFAARGPGRLVPEVLLNPLIGWRNRECISRLALTVEGRLRSGDQRSR